MVSGHTTKKLNLRKGKKGKEGKAGSKNGTQTGKRKVNHNGVEVK